MNKLFIIIGVVLVISTIGFQTYNTVSFDSKVKSPTLEEQLNPYDMSIRSDGYKDVANPYASYRQQFQDSANVPPWIPASLFAWFFAGIAYLYYKDMVNEVPNEMFGRYGGYHEL